MTAIAFLGAERQQVALEGAEQQIVARLDRVRCGRCSSLRCGRAPGRPCRPASWRRRRSAPCRAARPCRAPPAPRRSACAGRSRAAGRGRHSRCRGASARRRSRRGCACATCPDPTACGPIWPTHLVATMNWWRLPFSQSPTICSVRPARVVAAAQRIDVGGVEEIDAAGRRGIHDRVALGHVALQAERHRPEAQLGDAQAGAAQFGVVHGLSGKGVISL